jgi:hypothetical protein
MTRPVQARAGAAWGQNGPSPRPVFLKGLCIGLGVMAIQLGLLLDSFDLYVRGRGGRIWQLATAAGVVLLGSLVILWVLYGPPLQRRYRLPARLLSAFHRSTASPRHAA